MNFLQLAKARYSLRKYSDKPVEPEKIDAIMAAASLAPTGCNNQPQRILIVDDPAILDKIRKEKAQLVKEGKLKKKDLIETPITDDEKPFDIPQTWEWVKLSFITSLLDGEKREGKYICLDAKYLRGKSTGDYLSKGKFVNKEDSIILVDGENSGEVFTAPCDGYMGSTFKQLWISESLYLPFVLYFIRLYKNILRNSKKGAAIPHLNKEIFNNLVVGVPPLAEQKRIVAKIEELFAEIDKLK